MTTRFFAIIILLIAGPCFGDLYQASMQQARWEFKKTSNSCYLKQLIPQYGSAEFVQKAGEPLRFSIQEQRHKPLIIKASLKIMPAPWMREVISSVDYPVYSDNAGIGGFGRLSVYAEVAESMIDALTMGRYPTFVYVRDASVLNLEETYVAVSAIRFAESYEDFLSCRNAQVSVNAQHKTVTKNRKKQAG